MSFRILIFHPATEVAGFQKNSKIKKLSAYVDSPSIISIVSAQIAREFLGRYLPAAIISDTSFPLNGKKVVEWLQSHGHENYPLIGLSLTSFDDLDVNMKRFFGTKNARYFNKGDSYAEDFLGQVVYNIEYNRKAYKQ